MHHHFDIGIATKYGVNVALFLDNMAFWLSKNVANKRHFHDGFHWTYNSQEAFLKLFPYWSRQNLRTVINKCLDEGLIITGNYNETKYDRTGWYAFTEVGLNLYPFLKSLGCNQPMELMESTTSLVGINQPIPDALPDTKPALKELDQNKNTNQPHSQKRQPDKLRSQKAVNEKRHDFADSMDQMAREDRNIEQHEAIKQAEMKPSQMPDSLRQMIRQLKI